MKVRGVILGCSFLIPVASGSPHHIEEAWRQNISNPEIMSFYFNKKFKELPLEGSVHSKTKYWSGDYWALNKGNINYRWFAKKKLGFNYHSPTKEQVFKMTIPELAELSPTEKYDLFAGKYDYPLKYLIQNISDSKAQNWEGICHGWSPAAMNHNEPTPKLLKNPDGLEIPFGSSDIKALISYYYAYGFKAPDTYQMGRRCFKGGFLNNDKDCKEDLNAGAFHIVLTNRIGIDGKGFLADLNRFKEVWNHPFTSYKSIVLSEYSPGSGAADDANRVKLIRTTMSYVAGNGNDWHPVLGTSKQKYESVTYEYEVEINLDGEIVGGEWKSKQRPDFLWLMHKPRTFEGPLSQLNELLNDA